MKQPSLWHFLTRNRYSSRTMDVMLTIWSRISNSILGWYGRGLVDFRPEVLPYLLRRYPTKQPSVWHSLTRNRYSSRTMDGMLTIWSRISNGIFRRLFFKVIKYTSSCSIYYMEDGLKVIFWRIIWWGDYSHAQIYSLSRCAKIHIPFLYRCWINL